MWLSISAGIGFIAMSGVAMLDNMILVSYIRQLRRKGVPRDEAKARTLYERACTQGLAFGCRNLAVLVASGRGGPKSDVRALELYHIACERGDGPSCYAAAERHLTGQGVVADVVKGKSLLHQACQRGHEPGCDRLRILGGI